MAQIDIRDYSDAIEAINAIVSNGNVAEVKIEYRRGSSEPVQLTVVEQNRRVKDIENVRKAGTDK